MKKILFLTAFLAFANIIKAQEDCGSTLNLQQIQSTNPSRYQRILNMETHIQNYILNQSNASSKLINNNGQIIIPVVVHVLHIGEAVGSGFNISDAQVQSQIDVLNEDFSYTNADRANIPSIFQTIAGNTKISFQLACIDPNGNSTNGIVRKITTQVNGFSVATSSDGSADEFTTGIKFSSQGGNDAWQTDKYLNIWVCDLRSGLNGYSQLPDDYLVKQSTDGIVVRAIAFGRGFPSLDPKYNLGRTASHEIGHWLALRHPDGDSNCGDDFVADTPPEESHFFSTCPTFPHNTSCNNSANGEMYVNTMNSIPHACRLMFTQGQIQRMRAVFAIGGPRASFIDNYFSIKQDANTQCGVTFKVNNPACIPINWTVSNGASITSNGNLVTIKPTSFGNFTVIANAGNYTDSKIFTFAQTNTWVNISNSGAICSTPITYTISNLGTGSVVWSIDKPTLATLTTTGNVAKLTRVPNQNGVVALSGIVSNLCNFSPFTIKKIIKIGNATTPALTTDYGYNSLYPNIWTFTAAPNSGTFNWYVDGSLAATTSTNSFTYTFTGGCKRGGINHTIKYINTNTCGTTTFSNSITGNGCVDYGILLVRFGINPHPTIANTITIGVNQITEDEQAKLFFDATALTVEQVQSVSIIDKDGNVAMDISNIGASTTNIDVSTLAEGVYTIVVNGNNDYKEQQTYNYTITKTKQQLAEELATDNIFIASPDADKLKDVLKQELYEKLKEDNTLLSNSTVLQNFLLTKQQGDFGTIESINAALSKYDVTTAQSLINTWQPQSQLELNCLQYYNYFIKYLSGIDYTDDDYTNLYTLANLCPQKNGEIIFAARSLYNYVTQQNEEFATACGNNTARGIVHINAKNEKRETRNVVLFPNPSNGNFNIKFPATSKGINTVKVLDVYGKIIMQQNVISGTQNININKTFATGIYTVQITNSITGKTETQKLIINN